MNNFFSVQSIPLSNNVNYTLISYVDIDKGSIVKVIRSLSANRGDGCDEISVHKICNAIVSKIFFMIFENSIN